jgi:riboflavin kinase/FMN adenylyltransferase
MELIIGIDRIRRVLRNPVVALGNFDGIHRGHQLILKRTKQEAKQAKGESIVFTFEPHPPKILRPHDCPPLITPFKKKMLLIQNAGIDVVICATFTREFSAMTPAEFIASVLVDRIGIHKAVVGYNYCFGRDRDGCAEDLKRYAGKHGFEVIIVDPVRLGNQIVSSSVIRDLIQRGEMLEASRFLGRHFMVLGKVIWGTARGRLMGIPTANIEILNELYPRNGVYAVKLTINDQTYKGVANVGVNPTFSNNRFSVEVHIFDFGQEIYGREIQVAFIQRIRDEKAFKTPEKLVQQIRKDIDQAKQILATAR